MTTDCLHRASFSGRPVSFRPRLLAFLSFISLLVTLPAAQAALCPTEYFDIQTSVKHIYDGDTVKLDNGERVRLLGFNTPEMNYKRGSPEALAKEAKQALADILYQNNNRINLRLGNIKRDRYKRLLAHAYIDNGDNIGAMLLQKGFATSLVIPPNNFAIDCYLQQESQARQQRLGIWALPAYQVADSKTLDPDETAKGYRIIKGKVIQVKHSRRSIWLSLTGFVGLRVSRRDLENFTEFDPSTLTDKMVIARGWIRPVQGELVMRIRHPSALEIVK